MKCSRCDFTADDLTEHAAESQHRLCVVCQRRSLTVHQPQTCGPCVGRVRADLADIATDLTLVPAESLTGLTLLGDGTMQRHARPEEVRDNTRDEWPSDPLPVLAALASWEDMIRDDYGDPKGPPPTVTATVDYLTRHLDTGHNLAQTFHAFDELAAEIRKHHSAIRHAAGLADDPVQAPARCHECGGHLLRTYGDDGLTDDWTCEMCRRVFTQHDYFFRLRVAQVDAPGEWRPVAVAAWLVDRPFRTVQTWVRELSVRSACALGSRKQVVWMPDVKEQSDQAGKRRRAS